MHIAFEVRLGLSFHQNPSVVSHHTWNKSKAFFHGQEDPKRSIFFFFLPSSLLSGVGTPQGAMPRAFEPKVTLLETSTFFSYCALKDFQGTALENVHGESCKDGPAFFSSIRVLKASKPDSILSTQKAKSRSFTVCCGRRNKQMRQFQVW